MKTIEEITSQFCNELGIEITYLSTSSSVFEFYKVATGDLNGDYYDIYFRKQKGGNPQIEIAFTTKDPLFFAKAIRNIDKDIEIIYTEVIAKSLEKTY